MRPRLRNRFAALRAALRRRRPRRAGQPAPKGKSRNVIVVRPRDPRFEEVIFVLRDESFSDPEADRAALLREAQEAARRELGSETPVPVRFPLWPTVLLLLGAAVILKLCGLW